MKKLIACLALMLPATQALAEFPTGKVGASLSPKADFSLDGIPDGDGTALGFNGELGGEMVFGYADMRMSDVDVDGVDIEIDETRFGIGVRGGNDTGFLEARAEVYEIEVDVEGPSDPSDDDGIGVHVGGGIPLGGQADVFARYGFLSLDDLDGNELQFGVRGQLSSNVEVYGLYRMLSLEDDANDEMELDDLRLGLNLLF